MSNIADSPQFHRDKIKRFGCKKRKKKVLPDINIIHTTNGFKEKNTNTVPVQARVISEEEQEPIMSVWVTQ